MSSRIRINQGQLRNLAQNMKAANSRVVDPIKTGIAERNELNEHMSSNRTTREERLFNSMFVQVDFAGLSRLITSFTDSYNMRTTHRRDLNKVFNHNIPPSMSERFRGSLSTEELNSNPNWSVGGTRWGFPGNSRSTLVSRYNSVTASILALLNAVDNHETIFQDFARLGVRSRYMSTPGTGAARRALVSRANHAATYAIESFVGVSGSRNGVRDAIVASVRDALDVLTRNIETVELLGKELADQAISIANDSAAFDQAVANSIGKQGVSIVDNSQIMRSQVDLAIYRPNLLSDEKGVENAITEQLEERYTNLNDILTNDLFEVASFILNPTSGDMFGRTLVVLCDDAIRAIDNWTSFINRNVSFSSRPVNKVDAVIRLVVNTSRSVGQLRDFLHDNMVAEIDAARSTLVTWREAFLATQDRARDFVLAINNGVHVNRLHDRVERGIFPTTAFDPLATFATNAQEGLMSQALEYNRAAQAIRGSMAGNTMLGYVGALERGAKYVTAIAQTIEKDFLGGGIAEEVNRINSFVQRSSIRLQLSRKSFEELIELLGNFDENGYLSEESWAYIEQLLGNVPIDLLDLTNRNDWESLAAIIEELMPPLTLAQYQALAYVFGSMSEGRDMERFLELMTIPLMSEGDFDGPIAFAFHRDRMGRILEAGSELIYGDIFETGRPLGDELRHQMMQNMGVLSAMSTVDILRAENRGAENARPNLEIRMVENDDFPPHILVNFEFSSLSRDAVVPNLNFLNNILLGGGRRHGFAVSNVRYGIHGSDGYGNSLYDIMGSGEDSIPQNIIDNINVGGKTFLDGIASNIWKLSVGALKKKFPIVGAVSIGADLLGYGGDDSALVNLRNALQNQLNQVRYANFNARFEMETVVIWEGGTSNPTPISFPTEGTFNRIASVNEMISGSHHRHNISESELEEVLNRFNAVNGTEFFADGFELTLAHVQNYPLLANAIYQRATSGTTPLDDPNG